MLYSEAYLTEVPESYTLVSGMNTVEFSSATVTVIVYWEWEQEWVPERPSFAFSSVCFVVETPFPLSRILIWSGVLILQGPHRKCSSLGMLWRVCAPHTMASVWKKECLYRAVELTWKLTVLYRWSCIDFDGNWVFVLWGGTLKRQWVGYSRIPLPWITFCQVGIKANYTYWFDFSLQCFDFLLYYFF